MVATLNEKDSKGSSEPKRKHLHFLKISEDLYVFRCEMIVFFLGGGSVKKNNIIAGDTYKKLV